MNVATLELMVSAVNLAIKAATFAEVSGPIRQRLADRLHDAFVNGREVTMADLRAELDRAKEASARVERAIGDLPDWITD